MAFEGNQNATTRQEFRAPMRREFREQLTRVVSDPNISVDELWSWISAQMIDITKKEAAWCIENDPETIAQLKQLALRQH